MNINPVSTSASAGLDSGGVEANFQELSIQLDELCFMAEFGRLRGTAYAMLMACFEASFEENGLTDDQKVNANRIIDQVNRSDFDNNPFVNLPLFQAKEVIFCARDDELDSNPQLLGLAVFMGDEQGACLFFSRSRGCMALDTRQDLEQIFHQGVVHVVPWTSGNPFNVLLDNRYTPVLERNAITSDEAIAFDYGVEATQSLQLGPNGSVTWQRIESAGRN